MKNWLHNVANHPGWTALLVWWCGPVWAAVLTTPDTPRKTMSLWIAAAWSLFGLLMLLISAGTGPPASKEPEA